MSVDRQKYLDKREVRVLRTVTEAKCLTDLRKGRKTGVVQWMLVDLALTTGLRVSEMAAIKLKHIDFNRRLLTVTRVKRKHHKTESLAIGKRLIKHLREFVAWKRLIGDPMEKGSSLFTGERGALSACGLAQAWKSAVKRAGLSKEYSIHRARHTLATHLLRKTNNLRQVQKQLGHSSPVTTANMYADVSFEDMEKPLDDLYD